MAGDQISRQAATYKSAKPAAAATPPAAPAAAPAATPAARRQSQQERQAASYRTQPKNIPELRRFAQEAQLTEEQAHRAIDWLNKEPTK